MRTFFVVIVLVVVTAGLVASLTILRHSFSKLFSYIREVALFEQTSWRGNQMGKYNCFVDVSWVLCDNPAIQGIIFIVREKLVAIFSKRQARQTLTTILILKCCQNLSLFNCSFNTLQEKWYGWQRRCHTWCSPSSLLEDCCCLAPREASPTICSQNSPGWRIHK